ncbi:MAG: choice-of-anchor Q domain-containing protein [Isosphaeraceae bacterium]
MADPSGFTGLAAGVNGNLSGVDPRIEGLTDNGGAVPTVALLGGSPAIDAGSNPLGLTTDARGFLTRAVNGSPDIGAYEAGARPPLQNIRLNVFVRRGKRFLQIIDPTSNAVRFTVQLNASLGANFSRQTRDVDGDNVADAVLVKAGRKPITFVYSGRTGRAITPPKLPRG